MSFNFSQKVLFKHCDPAGIVFYPRYFEMVNDAVEQFFNDALSLPFETMHPDWGVPTIAINIQFRAPSRHGDMLEIALQPAHLGATSLKLVIAATCGDELRFDAHHTLVHVEGHTLKPAPWPDTIRDILAEQVAQYKESSHAAS